MENIEFWHWLALGFALLGVELFLPTGFVLMSIGTSAILVGAVSWLVPAMGWQAEAVLFAIGAVAGFPLWRRLREFNAESDKPTLNKRTHSYIGRVFTLEQPIVNGDGKLKVDDSQWRISGPDLAAGARVRVTDADGSTLKVEAAN